jgi:small subunit ribosomal protein S6
VSERYEVLFIVRPDVGDAGLKEQVNRARQVLEQQGATAVTVHDWGLRDLAYDIAGHSRGAYVLIEYEAMPPAVRELERTLKLSDNVMRYMSVRQSEGMAIPLDDSSPAAGEASAEEAGLASVGLLEDDSSSETEEGEG